MANFRAVLGLRLQDLRGLITSHQLFANIPEATTIAQMVAAAQAYCVLLDPLTDAAGILGHVEFYFPTTGLKTSPTDPGNNFNDNGLFPSRSPTCPISKASWCQLTRRARLRTGGSPSNPT